MFFMGKKEKDVDTNLKKYLKNKTFQKILIGICIILVAFFIVENGAAPKKYKLQPGEKSTYDITAPRDIENTIKTEEKAEEAAAAVEPVMIKLSSVPIDVLNKVIDYFKMIDVERESLKRKVDELVIVDGSESYMPSVEEAQNTVLQKLFEDLNQFRIPLTEEQVRYLLLDVTDGEYSEFEEVTRELISSIMNEDINKENISEKVNKVKSDFRDRDINQELQNIGGVIAESIIEPNNVIDVELTRTKRQDTYNKALESKVIISKDSRILSVGDVVTEDKLEILKDLNILETGKFDFVFALGILIILVLLAAALILYMSFFCTSILSNRNNLILIGVIILLTLMISRVVFEYSILLIPIFLAPMLLSILLDVKLAIVVNIIITIAVSLMTKGDIRFLYMAVINGTLSAFIVAKANQRSKLSATGLILALLNVLIIICIGIINKSTPKTIANESLMVSINGIASIVLTIGSLPFFESTFNVITPLKMLELANPNQPLIKRLLLEAPGTYHHSLMVSNLAEVATESINGNSLLARVGAYYHDIGKLERPSFFKENQLTDNPHDKMTPNLSTLVITSHTQDGLEMAERYKIPQGIREIIKQHHGTTLVAYFYYKAKKADKDNTIKQEDFRYEGPRPSSKEAAVVMLADSVEAAVRSMTDKTEGKIEGLVRKIIKDKLDDGQLDLCDLTLKDLDNIARSFMKVFSGYFHQREQYPNVKLKNFEGENKEIIDPMEKELMKK